MGAWGNTDDQNDNVVDILARIIDSIISNPHISHEDKQSYMRNHPTQLYNAAKKWLKAYKLKMFKVGYMDPHIIISGVALAIAKILKKSHGIPRNLPIGYPEWLRTTALSAIVVQLAEIHLNKLGWVDLAQRKHALQREFRYFSKMTPSRSRKRLITKFSSKKR